MYKQFQSIYQAEMQIRPMAVIGRICLRKE